MPSPREMPPTLPLFDEPPRVAKRRAQSTRSVATSFCPRCKGGLRVTGVVRTARHLVWREHTYRTYGGVAMTCSASGVAVCVLPPRQWTPELPGCPCGGVP